MFSDPIPKCTCVTECSVGIIILDGSGDPFSGCTYDTTIDYINDNGLANDVENGLTDNPFCIRGSCRDGLRARITIIVTCEGVVIGQAVIENLAMEQSNTFPDQSACVNAVQPGARRFANEAPAGEGKFVKVQVDAAKK